MEKQTESSLWNCFDTILQDMSADGAELDQFLSYPLISLVEDPHAQVSPAVTTRTKIPGTTTYQRPIREALQYCW